MSLPNIPTYPEWQETDQDHYTYAFECLPPIYGSGKLFACSEPWSHTKDGIPTYVVYNEVDGKFYRTIGTIKQMKDHTMNQPTVQYNACDQGHETQSEIRALPFANGNLLLCRRCYIKEMNYRRLYHPNMDRPSWESLRVDQVAITK